MGSVGRKVYYQYLWVRASVCQAFLLHGKTSSTMNNGCDQVGAAGGLCPFKPCCLAFSKKKAMLRKASPLWFM
jgi:hypothetical protein